MLEKKQFFSLERTLEKAISEKEKIELIENLPLDCQNKMELMLLYLGEQPVAWVEVCSRVYKNEEKDEVLNQQLGFLKEQIVGALEKIGFVYQIEEFKIKEEKKYNLGYDFLVSKNPKNLSRLLEVSKKKDYKEIGLAYGYPESACEAFVNETCIEYKEIPKEEKEKLIKEGTFKFVTFRLSQSHWKEEIELIKRWQQRIKETSSRLYEEILKEVDPLLFPEESSPNEKI